MPVVGFFVAADVFPFVVGEVFTPSVLSVVSDAEPADADDVPPPELLDSAEASAAGLETRVYGRCAGAVLLPLALTPTVSDGRREPLPAVKE